jgi:Fms-interacting protein/Thoc5
MGPPKKRWKQEISEGVMEEDGGSYNCGPVIAKVKDLCTSLSSLPPTTSSQSTDNKDGPASSATAAAAVLADASCRVLQLKALQSRLFESIRHSEDILARQASVREKQFLTLDNLKAQEAVNIRSVEECGIPNDNDGDDDRGEEKLSSYQAEMIKLMKSASASESYHSGGNDSNGDDQCNDNNNNKSILQQLSEFLDGADICDLTQRNTIMVKLNSEFSSRKQLESTLKDRQEQLKKLQGILSSKQRFIRDLPNRLNDIEKASLPLQKLVQKESSGSNGQLQPTASLIGSDRRRRFEMAEALPKPLYSLFYQVQSCLDVLKLEAGQPDDCLPIIDLTENSNTALATAVVATTTTKDPGDASPSVVLKVPVPEVFNSGVFAYKHKKAAIITFDYDRKTDLILTSCSTENGMSHLIEELFPGDDGEDGQVTAAGASNGGKFVYQWSNYLAGLHFAPSEQTPFKMRQSTMVIMKALIRRVRAAATLNRITNSLSWNSTSNLVTHPDLKSEFEHLHQGYGRTKLSSWTKPVTPTTSRKVVYEATLVHGSEKLCLNVLIDLARYPSVPPHWTEASTDPKDETLYNETVDKILHQVNRNVAELVLPSKEHTYEWILVQQLASLVHGWDASFS